MLEELKEVASAISNERKKIEAMYADKEILERIERRIIDLQVLLFAEFYVRPRE